MVKKRIYKIYKFLKIIGLDPLKMINFIRGIPFYYRDLRKIKLQKGNNSDFTFGIPYPILSDRFSKAGIMSGQYFHQDLLVAKRIYKNKPVKHVDIGSRIDGFIAHIAVFREIEVFDIRPQKSTVNNIVFKQGDLMKLPKGMENYCDSISSLHAIEHFGLGRYGDPVDYFGHIKAIDNIYRFSVPIGKQRIEFNAHRVFALAYLLRLFRNKFKIDSFSYVDDKGYLFENVDIDNSKVENNYDCNSGICIFESIKI